VVYRFFFNNFHRQLYFQTLSRNHFESKQDLIETILVACSIPGVCCPISGIKYKKLENCCDHLSSPSSRYLPQIDLVLSPYNDFNIPIKCLTCLPNAENNAALFEYGKTYSKNQNLTWQQLLQKYLRLIWRFYSLLFAILISMKK
jgi:hypothetical protein